MDPNYRYFATNDGAQVAVVRADSNPDVSWYEHKAAREVVLADPKDVVIAAKDLPSVEQDSHNPQEWDTEDDTFWFRDLADAERTMRNAAAVVQAMRLQEEQEQEAKAAALKAQVTEVTNVLLAHTDGLIETLYDLEALSQRLVKSGYKIVKEG